ncbi:MAG TPA: DNA starvation/stationary phase protection protein [Firmicutes bacterium]|jgi:starvation-inducible DNA-binding protein|nr:DNA starvation/stationary phase protection protein [Bacillota bacterium]
MNRIGLSNEQTKKVAEHLDQHLADLHVLYTKLHNYHWNIEGPEFFTLHAELEKQYDAVAEEIDAVAERMLMIGHRPSATLAEYLKKAKIKEAESAPIRGRKVVEELLADYAYLIAGLREGIKAAQEIGDEATADLMIGSLSAYEKTVWMLEAYLK